MSARYDFLYAGQQRYVPGIAVLAGLTLPTGRAPEDATHALATDATGIGAFQGNTGLAIEQLFDAWLVTAYGIVAKRASRTVARHLADTRNAVDRARRRRDSLPHDFAIAVSASYTGEGSAEVNGTELEGTSRRVPILGMSGVVPVSDHFRFQGGFSGNPPIPSLGKNQPAQIALTVTAVYAWY